MGWKIRLIHHTSAKTYQVWAMVGREKYAIGDPFTYTEEETQKIAWRQALKLAAKFERQMES